MLTDKSKPRSSSADYATVQQAEAQLQKAAKALEAMSDDVAAAKQIKEFNGDRHKRGLAIAMKVFLDMGESATAAECKARASDYYANKLAELGEQYQAALEVIEKADATRVLFEAARSLLSIERAKIGLL